MSINIKQYFDKILSNTDGKTIPLKTRLEQLLAKLRYCFSCQGLKDGQQKVMHLFNQATHQELSVNKFIWIFNYVFVVFYFFGWRQIAKQTPNGLRMVTEIFFLTYTIWDLVIMRRYFYVVHPEKQAEALKARKEAYRNLSDEQKEAFNKEKLQATKKKIIDFLLLRRGIMNHDIFDFPAAFMCLTGIFQVEAIVNIMLFWASLK